MQPNGQATDVITGAITGKKKPVVANSIKLDPQSPIPTDFSADIFRVVYGKKYLPFLGPTDIFANLLWNARLLSPTHNACISTIAQTCVGEGVYVTNVDPKTVDPEFLAWISNVNTDGESLSEIIKLAIEGLLTDGNGWVTPVKGSFAGEKYLKVYFFNTLYCRFGSADPKTGAVSTVIKSNQLAHPKTGMVTWNSLKAVTYQIYSPLKVDQKRVWVDINGDGSLHTMIHLKNNYGGVQYYGLPKSVSSLRHQVLEGYAAQYNIDNFENNMVPSAILGIKGAVTVQEAEELADNIIKTYTGQGKNGRIAIVASEGGLDDFNFQPLKTEKDGSYMMLDELLVSKIILAHGWDGLLAGLPDKGGVLGKGSSYIRAMFDIKQAMVLQPLESYIKQKLLRPLLAIAADHFGKPEWLKYDLGLKMLPPYSLMSDIDINLILTKDEGRDIIGYPAMKNPALGGTVIGTRVTETEVLPGSQQPSTPANPKGGGAL